MADPRADVKFDGIGEVRVTFKIDDSTITYDATEQDGSAQVGLAVTLASAETIELVGDGEEVLGKLLKVEKDGYAVVQTGGYMTLPGGSGATLTVGEAIVGDLGAASAEGYIRARAAATTPTAAEVDEAARCRGQIIDASVTTAVVVML